MSATQPLPSTVALPRHLHLVTIFGVSFFYGRTESTGGALWVVGWEPGLLDDFLPERWRTTSQIRFMESRETYFTVGKDDNRLVWKVSRSTTSGILPVPRERRLLIADR